LKFEFEWFLAVTIYITAVSRYAGRRFCQNSRYKKRWLRCDVCRRKKMHLREANHGLRRSSGGGEAPRRSGSQIGHCTCP
jgi:hypothetical protein